MKNKKKTAIIVILLAVITVGAVAGFLFLRNREEASQPEMPQVEAKPLLEAQEILNQKGVKITAKSLNMATETEGAKLRLLVENDTDATIRIDTPMLSSINNIMVDSTIDGKVEAGKKMHKEILFDYDQIKTASITTIKTLGFSLNIYQVSEDGASEELLYASAPIALRTTVDPDFVQSLDTDSAEINSQDGFSASIRALDKGRNNAYMVLKNETPYDVTVHLDSVSVNGSMPSVETETFSTDIAAGKVRFTAVPLGHIGEDISKFGVSFSLVGYKDQAPIMTTSIGNFSMR